MAVAGRGVHGFIDAGTTSELKGIAEVAGGVIAGNFLSKMDFLKDTSTGKPNNLLAAGVKLAGGLLIGKFVKSVVGQNVGIGLGVSGAMNALQLLNDSTSTFKMNGLFNPSRIAALTQPHGAQPYPYLNQHKVAAFPNIAGEKTPMMYKDIVA